MQPSPRIARMIGLFALLLGITVINPVARSLGDQPTAPSGASGEREADSLAVLRQPLSESNVVLVCRSERMSDGVLHDRIVLLDSGLLIRGHVAKPNVPERFEYAIVAPRAILAIRDIAATGGWFNWTPSAKYPPDGRNRALAVRSADGRWREQWWNEWKSSVNISRETGMDETDDWVFVRTWFKMTGAIEALASSATTPLPPENRARIDTLFMDIAEAKLKP